MGGPLNATSAIPTGHFPPAPHAPAARVEGIIIDVPDVLYDATLWRRWLLQLIGRLGIRVRYEEFRRAWDAQLVDVHRGRREYTEALQSFLLAYGLSWAQIDEIEAASRIQRRNLELNARPLPGVVRVIEALARRGLPLVAWADAPYPAEILAEQLGRILPRAPFRCVITSFDLECTQPQPVCYESARAALACDASETVYLGHDAVHLAGARACGLRTVAYNFTPAARADHYLTRFDELLLLAESWSIGRA